jgi:hypothetical protein
MVEQKRNAIRAELEIIARQRHEIEFLLQSLIAKKTGRAV